MSKTKLILSSILLLFLFIKCNREQPANDKRESDQEEIAGFNEENLDTLLGNYIGDFGSGKIRIVLRHIGKNHVVGYNHVNGLRRNISGTYSEKNDTVTLLLNEPGDNQYDGHFELKISLDDFKGTGIWKSNSGKIATKRFKFEKLPSASDIDEGKITTANFTNVFYDVSDSLGTIYFEADGSCIYEYFPEKSGVKSEQAIEIKGSWDLKDETVFIFWQPNSIFPSRKSELMIELDEYEYSLNGEGRKFYASFY